MNNPLPSTARARGAILAALRGSAAVPAPPPSPDLTTYHAGPYGRGTRGPAPERRSLIEPFVSAARSWRAEVLPATPGNWPQAVRQALDQRSCARVLTGRASELQAELAPALDGLQWQRYTRPLAAWKQELFGAIDAGITISIAGVADTGTLVLWTGPDEPRTLSLVPPVHVAVLRASRLYASLPAAMAALQPDRSMPSNLLLVSGPSKTADIQQVLAYGAHGPKELVIVLVDDLQEVAS
jgi:L-lactate dehydrogenase complex protein LldG